MPDRSAGSEALQTPAELQDAVFVKDLERRYLMVSDRAAALIGKRADEILGRIDEELMPADVAAQFRRHDDEVLRRGGALTLEATIVVDGEVRDLVTKKEPLRDVDGRVIGLIGVSTDMSAPLAEAEKLTEDVTEQRRRFEREPAKRAALLDPLTGVGNRTLAYDRLAHALTVAARRGSRVGVLYLDINDFKQVNDELGDAAGDKVLREVGTRLDWAVRESDTLARLGGDEFLVICEGLESDSEGAELAARVLACFGDDFEIEGQRCRLTASLGVAFSSGRDQTVDELIGQAEAAMDRDKAGRPPTGPP